MKKDDQEEERRPGRGESNRSLFGAQAFNV
jgi:hypothetical protein